MKGLLDRLSIIIASVFFIGYIPIASGTFGSLAALIFMWVLKPDRPLLGVLVAAVFCLGTAAAHVVEGIFGKDSGRIVIDEFAGFMISVFSLPYTPGYLIAGFFLFRFFDILKPPPIRNIEKAVKGGLGVMLDDVAAGLATNLLLQVWRLVA
ncbi:MAG: phosphatidylglycerophosphatase A [Nitrospirae bacterium]|nr:phosphatidylglycerophosphatase A [Nitrospirota bacterium]